MMIMAVLCKRTLYPKLGYIVARLTAMGIRNEFAKTAKGEFVRSWHADRVLMVDAARMEEAWALLGSKLPGRGRKNTLDEMPDNHPLFAGYEEAC